jgi:3-phosphoshikimate 1-carboxyvinyltransferase
MPRQIPSSGFPRLVARDMLIPGDISSAAFLLGAAALAESGEIQLRNVGVNPTRDGFLRVLARMGGRVRRENDREWLGEPVADLVAAPAALRATVTSPSGSRRSCTSAFIPGSLR